MNQQWLSFLGLALSAGAVITGEQMVVQAIQAKKVHLVILAEDTSANTFKKVTINVAFIMLNVCKKPTA
ncbi:MAG: ribosomal L7Ae/L30e/S12e/Gadd45 family protein [Turicibacter sanguinis]